MIKTYRFQDLFNSLVLRRQQQYSLSAQLNSWLNYKTYIALQVIMVIIGLYWAAAECVLYETIKYPMK